MAVKRMLMLLLAAAIAAAPLAGCARQRAGQGGEEERPSAAQSEPEPARQPEPDASTPQGAVAELFESAKGWDTEAMGAYLPDGVDLQTYLPAELQGSVRQLLDRMDYTVGAAASDGKRAVVQVTVTAADAESAMHDAVATAAATVLKGKLTGKEPSYLEVARAALDAIDIPGLPDKTTAVDAYMIREGEVWRLDVANPANMPLLNAVSGGAMELYAQFRELAQSSGMAPGE